MKLKEEGRTAPSGRQFQHCALKTVVEEIQAPIACNQVEYHVMLIRRGSAVSHCEIDSVGCYCPLAQGRVLPSGARRDRTQAQRQRSQVALNGLLDQEASPHPEGVARGKPTGQFDALKLNLMMRTGKQSRPCRRTGGV